MAHKFWQQFGNVLVAATPSGDRVARHVKQYDGRNFVYNSFLFYLHPADAEKVGRALVAAAHAARPALAEVRPAETEAV